MDESIRKQFVHYKDLRTNFTKHEHLNSTRLELLCRPFFSEKQIFRIIQKDSLTTLLFKLLVVTTLLTTNAMAQISTLPAAPNATLNYGTPINLVTAKKIMAAAEAEAIKNNWTVVIAIVDSASQLVLLQRLDNTQYGSIEIAKGKATTSVNYKRPSKALEDAVASGGAGLRLLRVDGLIPFEGGLPIIIDGKIVGAVGVSGMLSWQDAQVARAAAEVVK